MIAEEIQKTDKTLQERGIPEDSYFEVYFKDGSKISEMETNWSSMARKETVDFFGSKRVCYVSNYPIASIKIKLNGMEASIDEVSEDVEVYQFMRSERLIANEVDKGTIIGRGIGLVKNGIIIEERFINALENRVQGARK